MLPMPDTSPWSSRHLLTAVCRIFSREMTAAWLNDGSNGSGAMWLMLSGTPQRPGAAPAAPTAPDGSAGSAGSAGPFGPFGRAAVWSASRRWVANRPIAEKIVDLGADYLLATKDNQETAHAEIELYFKDAPSGEVDVLIETDKAHGRIETRRHMVSRRVDWMSGKRRYPDEPRFKALKAIAMVETRIEKDGVSATDRRCYISSRPLDAMALAPAARGPLGHRKRAALGARRRVQGGPIPPQAGQRRPKHGRRPPLLPQPDPSDPGKNFDHGKPKTRDVGPKLPRNSPRHQNPLTWTGCPAFSSRRLDLWPRSQYIAATCCRPA